MSVWLWNGSRARWKTLRPRGYCWLTSQFVLSFASLEVELKSYAVVGDRKVDLTDAVVAAAAVEEGVCVGWVDANDLLEVTDGLAVLGEPLVGDSSVVEGVDVLCIL